jgi:uncharacterized protein involved in response to NO
VATPVIDSSAVPGSPRGWALFGYGFRPFFLLAALYAPTAVAAWLLVLTGVIPDPAYMGGPLLHSHEMVFGFAVAGVLGFLTTALPNFAGATPLTGRPLALLTAVWLAGRLALWTADWLPPLLVAAADLALVPVALVLLLRSLPHQPNRRMLVFPALFAVFGAANVLTHAEALGWTADTGALGVALGINLIALLVAIIGGRIAGSRRRRRRRRRRPAGRPCQRRAALVLARRAGRPHAHPVRAACRLWLAGGGAAAQGGH